MRSESNLEMSEVFFFLVGIVSCDEDLCLYCSVCYRLRQTDIKAGHYERKVQALEESRDQWEAKYEEMSKKYALANKELEDFRREIEGL